MTSKYATSIMIQNRTYNQLREYRDTRQLKSFTEAIDNLLQIERSLHDINFKIDSDIFNQCIREPLAPDDVGYEDNTLSYSLDRKFGKERGIQNEREH